LACRIAPAVAARRLNNARVWWFELPDTYSRLVAGGLHEQVAEMVVSETRHLDSVKRGQVDEQLKAGGVSRMRVKAATSCIRKAAYEIDREGYVRRGAPNANTAGSGSARYQTPWRCSAATCP
jgi:hypothetical protein